MTKIAVDKDGHETAFVLTSDPRSTATNPLCVVHLLDSAGNMLDGIQGPICARIPKEEAIRKAEEPVRRIVLRTG
jgi:hypothetical protein